MTTDTDTSLNEGPVLITGIGKRLGFACAKHLLAQGIRVIGTYRTFRPELSALTDAGATLYTCDFYQDAAVRDLISQIKINWTSLRAIIHNASDWLPEKDLKSSEETFNRMMRVHAQVPYLINLHLTPLLVAHSSAWRDIIHVSDAVTFRGSKNHIAYAASKAALDNLTLSFAQQLAPEVKVNTIAPALMLFNEDDTEEYKTKALSKALIPREGGAEEFLRAVDYILDSHYMTGQTIRLDGGRQLK